MNASRDSGHTLRRELALVVSVAVVARVLYLATYRHSPFFSAPILDSALHDQLARAIAAGNWDAGAPYFRPPLFPWLLGFLYAVAGAGPWPGRLLNLMAGSLTAVAVLVTGARLRLGRRPRLVAALATALYAPELFFEGELLAAPVATALGAWGLFWCVTAWNQAHARRAASRRRPDPSASKAERGLSANHRPSPWMPWFLAGLFWALGALARAPLALLPAGAMLLAGFSPGPRLRRMALTALAPLVVWTGPALIMASHGAGFRFPATQGGVNFAVGNHAGADGRSVTLPQLGKIGGWRDFADASVRVASRGSGRVLTPAEASGWWYRQGLSYWKDHPGSAVFLTARKALYLIHGFEAPNNRSLYEARSDVPWLRAILWNIPGLYWPTGLLFPLAALGIWACRRRRRWIPVLLYAVLTLFPLLFFFVTARFRLPSLPALALLAVAPWTGPRKRWVLAGALLLFFYALGNFPWSGAVRTDPARDFLARGESSLNAGSLAAATRAYRRALQLDPREGRAHLGLAVVAEREGRIPAALDEIRRAASRLSGSWELENAWARLLDESGRPEEAVPHRRRAVRLFPEQGDLHARLGLTLEAAGHESEAAQALEQAARLGCGIAEAWNSLGRFRLLAGDTAGARAAWDRSLAIAPRHFKARYNRGLLNAREGRMAAARADLEMALQAAPDEAGAARARHALDSVRSRLP